VLASAVACDRGKSILLDRKEAVMARLERRYPRLPDLFDLFEEPWPPLLPFTAGRAFRVEDCMQEGDYVLPAELPGLDPEKDVEVSVEGGMLTIHAETAGEAQGAASLRVPLRLVHPVRLAA
jgi:HSP20 family molecular chaperone IbpA